MTDLAPRAVIEQALAATAGLFARERNISLETRIAATSRRSEPMPIVSPR